MLLRVRIRVQYKNVEVKSYQVDDRKLWIGSCLRRYFIIMVSSLQAACKVWHEIVT